jgi:hypothetical protein
MEMTRKYRISDDIAQVNHKNTKKKEKNGEFFFHQKRGDPIPRVPPVTSDILSLTFAPYLFFFFPTV